MTPLTEDTLTWYSTTDDPGQSGELLVETPEGYLVRHAAEPWPQNAFRWAQLPRRMIQ